MDPEEPLHVAKEKAATTSNITELATFICLFIMLVYATTDILYAFTTGHPSTLFGVSITPKTRDNTEL